MKDPADTDRVVRVRASLNDRCYGIPRWTAEQFSRTHTRPALLLIFETEGERDAAFARLSPPGKGASR